MKRSQPVNVIGDERVTPPEHDAFAVLEYIVPACRAGIGNTDNIRKNAADSSGRVAVDAADKTAAEIQ